MTSSAMDGAEARYRALFETMGPAVLLMRGPVCIDCNPATLELFGIARREDFIGKGVLDFAPEFQPNGERSADLVQRHAMAALEHGAQTFEWQSTRVSGEPFFMEVRFTRCGPPEEGLFLCIAVDISERRRAGIALKQSEERFRTIVERVSEGLLVADAGTRQIRYANPQLCHLLGWSNEELLGQQVEALHPPRVQAQVLARFARPAGAPWQDVEWPVQRRDGTTFEVLIRAVESELDGRRCWVHLLTDLTAQRRAEADRLKAQKLEALGTLAGGIAHDFNNLLQGAMGLVATARLATDITVARGLLDECQQTLASATRLTGQLLTFSRGGAPLKAVASLGPLVERATQLAASGSSAVARTELPAGLWTAEVDQLQLEQVIQNLVLNAVQAMPGGGRVTVGGRNVTGPAGEPFVELTVADTGPGIPAALEQRIFEPYFTTKPRSSGLGLATAWSIVKHHGGTLTVESRPGATTFTVRLPATGQPATSATPPPMPRAAKRSRVLLMDDDTLILRVTSRLIGLFGHEVETAAEGAQAVERYRAAMAAGNRYDLVILDLTIRGGMGGLEALAQLKRLDPSVRAIVSSGYSDDSALSDHLAHGFRGALRKPYDRDALEAALAEHLAG